MPEKLINKLSIVRRLALWNREKQVSVYVDASEDEVTGCMENESTWVAMTMDAG